MTKNQFDILSNLDSDHEKEVHQASNERARARKVNPSGKSPVLISNLESERTPYHIFRDAAEMRLHLLTMIRDQPLDLQSKKLVQSSVKELEAEEKRGKVTPFDSARVASLEACIRSMKGLCPLKIKDLTKELQSSIEAKSQKGASFGVESKNEAEKEGCFKSLPTELDTPSLVQFFSDEVKGATPIDITPKVEDVDPLYGGAIDSGSVAAQVESEDGSEETGLACEDEGTSEEEDDSLNGDDKQDESVPSEA
ncbi:hypothetical protein U1Q18_003277 [Sarracenia purpurea var. burkii]